MTVRTAEGNMADKKKLVLRKKSTGEMPDSGAPSKPAAESEGTGSPPAPVKAAASRKSGETSIPIPVVVDVVKNLCLAFSDITLYDFKHPLARKQIGETWEHLRAVLEEHGTITLSLADNKLFFEGIALEEKNPSVKKLSHHFDELQVTSLTFKQGMDAEEMESFFEVFSMDHAAIEAEGGLENVFAAHGVKDIRLNSAVYRLIHEDEKIVAADSVLMERRGVRLKDVRIDDEIVRYFIEELLRRADKSDVLINRMKNDPAGLAEQVERILHYSDDQLEKVQYEDLMEAMLKNIRLTAEAIARSEGPSADPEIQTDMQKAVTSVEGELQRRKQAIASSGAVNFVRRMTDLIAAYSDAALADAARREFVEQEHSLEAVQKMLSEISMDADASRRLLQKLQHIMEDHDVDAEEMLDLLDARLNAAAGETAGSRRLSVKTIKGVNFGPVVSRLRQSAEIGLKRIPEARKLTNYLQHAMAREVRRLVGSAAAAGTAVAGGDRVEELTARLRQLEGELDEARRKARETDDLQAEVMKLKADAAKKKEGIAKLKQACVDMRSQKDLLERQLRAEIEHEQQRRAAMEAEFEQQLDDEVGTAMGMVDESENVRLRLERMVSTMRVGIVVVDREGRVVTSINAENIPYLQCANLPPPELTEALRNFDRSTVIQCEGIDIFEVHKDENGFLEAFMFLPHQEDSVDERLGVLTEIFSEIEEDTAAPEPEPEPEATPEPVAAPPPTATSTKASFEALVSEIEKLHPVLPGETGQVPAATPPLQSAPPASTAAPEPEPETLLPEKNDDSEPEFTSIKGRKPMRMTFPKPDADKAATVEPEPAAAEPVAAEPPAITAPVAGPEPTADESDQSPGEPVPPAKEPEPAADLPGPVISTVDPNKKASVTSMVAAAPKDLSPPVISTDETPRRRGIKPTSTQALKRLGAETETDSEPASEPDPELDAPAADPNASLKPRITLKKRKPKT